MIEAVTAVMGLMGAGIFLAHAFEGVRSRAWSFDPGGLLPRRWIRVDPVTSKSITFLQSGFSENLNQFGRASGAGGGVCV